MFTHNYLWMSNFRVAVSFFLFEPSKMRILFFLFSSYVRGFFLFCHIFSPFNFGIKTYYADFILETSA